MQLVLMLPEQPYQNSSAELLVRIVQHLALTGGRPYIVFCCTIHYHLEHIIQEQVYYLGENVAPCSV